jgi:hypothetical protein
VSGAKFNAERFTRGRCALVLKRLRIGAAMGLAQEAIAATVFPRGARRAEKKI